MEESGLVWHPYAEGLTIRDDDESGLTVSSLALTIDEGDDGTYTVVLKSEPPGTVEVSVSGTAGTDLTLSRSSLTFTPSDWNVAQMVTVTAGQDDDASDDMAMLTHTASRSDYGALALPVTVTDDEGRSGGGGGDESNRPPVFDQSYTFDLRENRSGREVPVVLGTVDARDPDGDDMHYSLFAGDRDRFTVSRDSGTVSYIGQGEDFELGPSRFELQVTANDGQYQTRGRVVVRVVDVAEGPEAGDDEAETPEDTPTVIDVLSNDRDPDGDQLRIASVGAAEHGTTAVVSDGIQYAPELNWHGTDRFTYTVSDESGVTATATVTVTVLPVNDPPEAVDDEAETLEDEAVVVDVLANDTDADGDPIRVVSVGPGGSWRHDHGAPQGPILTGSKLAWDGPLRLHDRRPGRVDGDGDGDDDRAAGQRCAGGGRGHPGSGARGRRGAGDGGPDAVLHRRGRRRADLHGGVAGRDRGNGDGRRRDADLVGGGDRYGDGDGDGDGQRR